MLELLLSRLLGPVAARMLRFDDADFSTPVGEPAVLTADSVSWRVFSNPVAVYAGGVAAVLLEFGEPRVRSGVWDHSSFRSAPGDRMRRTGAAAMISVYGARSRFEALAQKVNAIHDRIAGVTPAGEAYRANDPELLLWVQATASFAFLEAYARFVEPLSRAERDLYFSEAALGAPLYGVDDPPLSEADAVALFDRFKPRLEPSPTLDAFLDIMRNGPLLPRPMRPLQRLVARAAVDLMPENMRSSIGLESRFTSAEERAMRALAGIARRIHVSSSPWAQACVRVGLPPDYLRRRG